MSFSPRDFFSHFLQSSEISAGYVFHLFKLKFSMVTPLVLLSKRKYQKIKINCRVSDRVVRKSDRFVSRLDQIESTRTFRKIRPPLFSSNGNQSFMYTVGFTSTLSFECSCVRPISPVSCHFPVLQPFRAIAFAYFNLRLRSFEFVSWSRSCCWLGLIRV